ncbi:MAG: PAS domain S-box protein [Waterburya sp.]
MNSLSQELEELYNKAPCGYHSLDSEGKFIRINDTELKMLGYSREEVLGRQFSELITPESLSIFQQNFPNFKERGWVNDLEFQFICKDGTLFPVSLSATAIKDEAGNFVMSRSVVIDISERQRAEKAAEEISQRAAKLDAFRVSLSNALRPLTDADEIQAIAARVLGEYLGASRVIYIEVLSGDEEVIVHKNYTNGVAQLSGRYRLEEYRRNLSDNHQTGQTLIVTDIVNNPKYTDAEKARYSTIEIAAHIDVPLIKNDRFVALLAVHQATPRQWTETEVKLVEETAEQTWAGVERARAEAALRESEEKYRTLFESIDEGFCTIEVLFDENNKPFDYRFLEINPAFEKQTGLSDAQGKRMRELAPNHEEHWFEIYGEIALTGKPIRFENRSEVMHRWFDVFAFRFGKPENRQVAVLFQDISDRKQVETSLQEAQESLEIAIEAAQMGTWHLDLTRDVSSKRSLRHDQIFGYQTPQLEWGEAIARAHIVEADREIFDAAFAHARETGKLDFEVRVQWPDGSIHWMAARGHFYFDEQGNPVRGGGVNFDISDRKQAEIARERFLAVASDLQVIIGSNGYFHWVSPTFQQALGWTTEEMTSRPWIEFIHPDDISPSVAETTNLFSGNETISFENRYRHRDGSYRWLLWTAQPYPEEQLIYGAAIDITERKQAELALQQQIAREHLLAKITQAIHQTLDVEQILQSGVDLVRQFLQTERVIIFHFQPDWSGKVVAESVVMESISILESEITDPCFGERYVEPYRQGRVSAITDFQGSDVELCYQELMAQFQVRANLVVPILQREHLWGLLIAHHCSAPRPWQTEEVELLQQLATQLGIAIQQAELYQQNVQQAALIDITSDAIFVCDLSNRILFWSQGAERMYGWRAAEVLENIAHELFQQESLSQLTEAQSIVIEQNNWHGELQQLTKDGREIIVESRWTLITDQQGNPQSILVVNTDITEKKQLEKQLLHSQRIESIGTLAGGIAHDLNNILTPILGFTQLLPLKISNLDKSSLEMLQLIRNNALRGSKIVKQVLLFSRNIETEWELVNLVEVLEEVLKLILETFPKSITIEDFIAQDLWMLDGDSTQLHQVLMNLCVNARDAMPDGGKLFIAAENLRLDEQYFSTNSNLEMGNYILITVTDTGMGIPPEIVDRIFEPFFTTKKPGQGTGLGLSTVIGIVKNHGGTINLESDRQNGTQFQIYLPASAAITANEVITETPLSGQQELILVVDDEVMIQEVTKATLESYNYRVITANDGIEAIAIYAQQPQAIAVVLMDLIMPEMDGLTAMRALKKINPNVKLIVTSGLATKENITTAESIGIQSFLVKPYTAEKLLFNLNKAIAA